MRGSNKILDKRRQTDKWCLTRVRKGESRVLSKGRRAWRLAQTQSLFLPQGSAGSARWAQKVPWGLGCRTGAAEIGGRWEACVRSDWLPGCPPQGSGTDISRRLSPDPGGRLFWSFELERP